MIASPRPWRGCRDRDSESSRSAFRESPQQARQDAETAALHRSGTDGGESGPCEQRDYSVCQYFARRQLFRRAPLAKRIGRTQRLGPFPQFDQDYDFDSLPCRLRVKTFSTTRSTSVRKKPFAGCCTATFVPCPSAEAISFQR